MTEVRNNSKTSLTLPRGLTIKGGETATVKDWSKQDSHPVVAAWLRANALEVVGEGDADAPSEDVTTEIVTNEDEPGAKKVKTEEELKAMTADDLTAAIKAAGGEVNWKANKADLVKAALDLKL